MWNFKIKSLLIFIIFRSTKWFHLKEVQVHWYQSSYELFIVNATFSRKITCMHYTVWKGRGEGRDCLKRMQNPPPFILTLSPESYKIAPPPWRFSRSALGTGPASLWAGYGLLLSCRWRQGRSGLVILSDKKNDIVINIVGFGGNFFPNEWTFKFFNEYSMPFILYYFSTWKCIEPVYINDFT